MTDKTQRHLALKKFNEDVWAHSPDRAESAAIDAIKTGGFGCDCLDRRVGNYEGQIMAIERGGLTKKSTAMPSTRKALKPSESTE
jgi:hypothetical protein